MGRRGLTTEEELKQFIDRYKEIKDEEVKYKKSSKKLNDDIKSIMFELDVREYSSDNYTVKLGKKENIDFNEEKAIEILRQSLSEEDFKSAVKTKEYIDDDALESLVYNGKFDITILETCKTVKEPTYRLTIGKRKK